MITPTGEELNYRIHTAINDLRDTKDVVSAIESEPGPWPGIKRYQLQLAHTWIYVTIEEVPRHD